MKQLASRVTAVALAALATVAPASELGSNALELGHARYPDGSSGPVASVNAEIGEAGAYAGLGYGRARLQYHDIRLASAWLGYAHGVAPLTDVIGETGVLRALRDGLTAESYYASLGVSRAVFGERAIASVRANHYLGGDLEASDTTAAVGLDLYFTPRWSVLMEMELAESGRSTLLALHYNY